MVGGAVVHVMRSWTLELALFDVTHQPAVCCVTVDSFITVSAVALIGAIEVLAAGAELTDSFSTLVNVELTVIACNTQAHSDRLQHTSSQ